MIPFFRKRSKSPKAAVKPAGQRRSFEHLEDRSVLSSFSVVNLSDHGAGSLRQAILDANATAGADVIDFNVAGTIRLTTGALPTITDAVEIDGTTAPNFATSPVVEVDFGRFGGLQLNPNAADSALLSLSLVNASNSGVTITGGGDVLLTGDYIGMATDGTIVPNLGSGVTLTASTGNTIGGTTLAEANVISGNRINGITLTGSSSNKILGNFIGTDATGTLDRGNTGSGIVVTGGANNIIGQDRANTISGNDANGVLLTGKSTLNTVSGNIIGLSSGGNAVLGNRLDGVKLDNSDGNVIGNNDAVSSITYNNADNVPTQPVSGWQGIRNSDVPGHYLMTGTSSDFGLLFDGTMDGQGTSYAFSYPGALTTSAYGPDNRAGTQLGIVGSYKNSDYATAPVEVNGFLYQGTAADLGVAGNYRTVDYPGAQFNYVHSTMGGLVVGNYDSALDHGSFSLPFGPGHAFIYDIASDSFLTDVVFPGSISNTAYGIWYNGGTSYTICGGYSPLPDSNFDDQNRPIGQAYLVDYDSATGKFSNWASFSDPNGNNFLTHFQGISSVEKGVYTLSADSVQSGVDAPAQGSWVTVRRNTDGSFGPARWVDLDYTGFDPQTYITSANSVYGNQVIGIVIGGGSAFSYQATVNTGFRISNLISGNGGNGISLNAANDNQIAMNFIGTDGTGTIDLGNVGDGILVTSSSARNMIGGEATGGNNPTDGIYVRPPLGNLISGNNASGVMITGGATQNQLSGNFIGTDAAGNAALGNSQDGVAIVSADNNALVGCTFQQDPFVFYNVISGNAGNGLRVTNSNDTTIQANFFGMGADNNTAVGNHLNGVLIEGSSRNTTMGGPIPLGNVDSANLQNGIVVKDTASYFVSYNTFCGLAAFSNNPNFGNGMDGMLITSTGGNNLIRTCIITRNGDNGVELFNARDVRVTGNIIGMNDDGLPMGNDGNGVEVGGNSSDIVIGGPQPTFNIVPQNTIGDNHENGVAVIGTAHNITISNSFIGTDLNGTKARGNHLEGVFLAPGTYSNTVGSSDPQLHTVISDNHTQGIELRGTHDNTVINTYIGTNASGVNSMPNGQNGVLIDNSSNNVIGRIPSSLVNSSIPSNIIANNLASGVSVLSGSGNAIGSNSIHDNGLLGIDLAPGANADQLAPLLFLVQTTPSAIHVAGTLTSTPNTMFTLEFFANSASAPSGQYLLGSKVVWTDGAGLAAFVFTGKLPPPGASFITATATDENDNTSEFSAPVS